MESGGSSNSQQRETTRVPNSAVVIPEPNATTNIPNDGSNLNPQQTFRRISEQHMPIANVTRIMRRVLPPHAKIADDAKETIQECVSEFIGFITNEANENCRRECRKTIGAEDILSAMGTLGFDDYVEPLTVFLNKYRAQDPERGGMHHVPYSRLNAGIIQQQPAAQTALPPQPAPLTTVGGAPPPPTPPAAVGYAPPLPPTYPVDGSDYVDLQQLDDFLIGGQSGGEGSSSATEFDPFWQFK